MNILPAEDTKSENLEEEEVWRLLIEEGWE